MYCTFHKKKTTKKLNIKTGTYTSTTTSDRPGLDRSWRNSPIRVNTFWRSAYSSLLDHIFLLLTAFNIQSWIINNRNINFTKQYRPRSDSFRWDSPIRLCTVCHSAFASVTKFRNKLFYENMCLLNKKYTNFHGRQIDIITYLKL